MKNKLKQLGVLLLILGWMALIFGFSSQNAEASGGVSALISSPIAKLITAGRNLSDEAYNQLYFRVDLVVRKCAHFSEYAILGGLLLVFFSKLTKKRYGVAWLCGTVYAVLDEWHQAYSPGRSCEVRDVLLDSAGVICGIVLIVCIGKIRRKHHVYH